MAVGDIIVGITSGTGVYTNYQPSSSVELIVTSITGYDIIYFGHYDGTNFTGSIAYGGGGTTVGYGSAFGQMSEMKIGITNTYYFRFQSSVSRAYFSAIQTK